MSRLLQFSFGGLILWGVVTWLGTGLVALGIAILAICLVSMGLDSTKNHAAELQRLRERLTTLEENLNSAYERASNDIDRVREQNRQLSEQLETMHPKPRHHDY